MSDNAAGLRLFVALELPEEVRHGLDRTQSELRAALAPLNASWTRPENLHLTLRFLGAVPELVVPTLVQSLQDAASHCDAPCLVAEGLGCFPTLRRPRVVWAGITNTTGALAELHREIAVATTSFTAEPDEHAYHAHVTLARFKQTSPRHVSQIAEFLRRDEQLRFGEWSAGAVNLMRSELSSTGSRYTLIARCPLRRSAVTG